MALSQRPVATSRMRRAASKFLSTLFSDRVALPVACLGGAAALFFAVAEMQQPCAVSAAAALPWFMSVFFKEGGEK